MRRTLQAACGVSSDAPIFVTVSRFHPEKRLGMLLEAFKKVRETHEVGWVIYGHGPQRASFDKRGSGVWGVAVEGFQSSSEALAAAPASCVAMLHGSAAETFGLVVAEGICSGLPVIAPDVGGAADLVEDAWGIHYSAGDADACAQAMRAFLARGADVYADGVARAAAERIQTEKQHFDQLFAYYGDLSKTT